MIIFVWGWLQDNLFSIFSISFMLNKYLFNNNSAADDFEHILSKIENIVAKGEIAGIEQFLLLSLFSKSCLLHLYEEKVKTSEGKRDPFTDMLTQNKNKVFRRNLSEKGS